MKLRLNFHLLAVNRRRAHPAIFNFLFLAVVQHLHNYDFQLDFKKLVSIFPSEKNKFDIFSFWYILV
jgi:hypothetical protein